MFIESGITFTFGSAVVDHTQGNGFGYGMKDVDFILREQNRTILIEIKATGSSPSNYLSDDVLIEFVEKARDTYTFLHLMDKILRPLEFTAVVKFTGEKPESPFLLSRQESLRAKLRRQNRGEWSVTYIDDAYLVSIDDFEAKYPGFTVE